MTEKRPPKPPSRKGKRKERTRHGRGPKPVTVDRLLARDRNALTLWGVLLSLAGSKRQWTGTRAQLEAYGCPTEKRITRAMDALHWARWATVNTCGEGGIGWYTVTLNLVDPAPLHEGRKTPIIVKDHEGRKTPTIKGGKRPSSPTETRERRKDGALPDGRSPSDPKKQDDSGAQSLFEDELRRAKKRKPLDGEGAA